MNEKIILENVKTCLINKIKEIKQEKSSQFYKGKMEAYCDILSSMGIADEDIIFFVAGL
jgi:hypothetical protein